MYPNVNERNSSAGNYPGFTDNYQPNNAYVPTAPTAYSNQPAAFSNPTQTTTVNNPAMNAAMMYGNQPSAGHHGAGYNPAFQED